MTTDDSSEYLEDFIARVEPKEIEKPVWIVIDPFICYFCKKLNEFYYESIFEKTSLPEKLPIYSDCSYPCKYCKTRNVVIDPYDYKIIKSANSLGNLSSLIY